jgi:hypothetical protein
LDGLLQLAIQLRGGLPNAEMLIVSVGEEIHRCSRQRGQKRGVTHAKLRKGTNAGVGSR